MKAPNYQLRIRIIFSLLVCFAFLLIYRLYTIQVVSGEEFRMLGENQYVRPAHNLFDRGDIFFTTRDGQRVPAATLKHGFIVAINPTLLDNPEQVYSQLSETISIQREKFIEHATKESDPYEEIASKVESDSAERIDALDIDGLDTYKQQWRYYPGGNLAAHTIGFIAYNGDVLEGQYGLERQYEEVLSRDGSNTYVNFFAELFSNIKDVALGENHGKGDIVTTIEPQVQAFVEKELSDVQELLHSDHTGAIVMNPKTGEIISMAFSPAFDLNDFRNEDVESFKNPLVENVYEMGSIVKPLTMAAGLDAGAVTSETTYYDAGFLKLNTEEIHNYDERGRGTVSMQIVLNESLNTGVAFVVSQMGIDSFREYMYRYGLGEKTGIDLPGEVSGLVTNLESKREIEHATASFGQGIAITPIAITRALASLGNGGVLVTPHVVKRIEYENDTVDVLEYSDMPRVISEKTSEEISRMLVRVVDEALAGGDVALRGHTIAAKTGTAQIADPNNGGYYDDRYLHSFFGYFPAFDPEFIVFVYTVEPKGVRYASQSLTEPFMDITKFLINYYGIAPDR